MLDGKEGIGEIMTFHQLTVFCQVVESGSVTRASEQLGVPQPAVTRVIRSLEDELGVRLLDRWGKGIRINDNGRLLYDYARQVLRLTANLESSMEKRRSQADTTISIIVEAASHLFPSICAEFGKSHPDAKFRVLHQDTPEAGGSPDYPMRLFSTRQPAGDSGTRLLADEEIKLAVQPDGPLADKDRIELGQVGRMDFVALFKTRGLRRITDYYCQEAGFEPNVIFETDNTSTLMRYVSSGHGLAFIPALTWPRETEGVPVHLLTITRPVCRRSINLTLDQERLGLYEQLFADFLVEYFRKLSA